MTTLEERLNILRSELKKRKAKIMIIGLGSVGNYLMDYLMSECDEQIEICAVGRNKEKLQSDVNIVKVASLIRGKNRSRIKIIDGVDLDDVSSITDAFASYQPDIVINALYPHGAFLSL